MEITVDVLDPDVVRPIAEQEYIQENMDVVLAENELQVANTFSGIKTEHKSIYDIKYNAYRAQAEKTIDTDQKTRINNLATLLLADFGTFIEPVYDKIIEDWIAVGLQIKELYTAYLTEQDKLQKRSLRRQLIVQLESRTIMLTEFKKFVAFDIDRVTTKFKSPEINKAKIKLASKSKLLFDSGGLLESRYAYYVVKADDDKWAKYYDRSFGKGVFGNTDIAIKALGPGNFTVKGLSFNPSDITNAASKVTTQALILAAQISGVPINIDGDVTGDGAQLAKSSSRISSAITAQDSLAIDLKGQSSALLRFTQAILDEKEKIEKGTAAEVKESIEAINAVYQSQSSRFSIASPNE